MENSPTLIPEAKDRPLGDDRLSSWKEIAAYLGRDVRTVQRWKETQGLPVHRHRHSRLSTAYAFKSELDAWWHNQPAASDERGKAGSCDSTEGLQSAGMEATVEDARTAPTLNDRSTGTPPASVTWSPIVARSRRLGAILIFAGVAFAGSLLFFVTRQREPGPSTNVRQSPHATVPPVANQVSVSVFSNRTGDPTLDSFGELAANRVIQGLAQISRAKVDVTAIPHAVANTPGDTDTRASRTVVTGSYYLRGDELEVQTQILELPGRGLVHAVKLVTGRRADIGGILNDLQDRVAGAVALRFDDIIELALTSTAPSYMAYREWVSGVELFGKDKTAAFRHLERALSIEPAFVWAALQLAAGLRNENRYEEADKLTAPFRERRDELSDFERFMVDWDRAQLQGLRNEALAQLRGAAKLSPRHPTVNYLTMVALMNLNHPQAALDAYSQVAHLESMERNGAGAWRLAVAARARHMLRDYAGELKEVDDAIRVDPQAARYRGDRARALIGLGRVEEAIRLADEILALPGTAGETLLNMALELRAHGHRARADALVSRVVHWYRSRPPDAAMTETVRAGLARALYVAAEWDEADRVFNALAQEFPRNVDYLGALGAVAARRGDGARAERHSRQLASIEQRYLFGRSLYWRARLAALVGDAPTAVNLLRESFAQGQGFVIDIHRDVDLEPLATVPAFRAMVTPK